MKETMRSRNPSLCQARMQGSEVVKDQPEASSVVPNPSRN